MWAIILAASNDIHDIILIKTSTSVMALHTSEFYFYWPAEFKLQVDINLATVLRTTVLRPLSCKASFQPFSYGQSKLRINNNIKLPQKQPFCKKISEEHGGRTSQLLTN